MIISRPRIVSHDELDPDRRRVVPGPFPEDRLLVVDNNPRPGETGWSAAFRRERSWLSSHPRVNLIDDRVTFAGVSAQEDAPGGDGCRALSGAEVAGRMSCCTSSPIASSARRRRETCCVPSKGEPGWPGWQETVGADPSDAVGLADQGGKDHVQGAT